MYLALIVLRDQTTEVNEKHPKEELLSIWSNLMIIFIVLFALTYSILIYGTGLFFIFYGYVLFALYRTWNHFGYSKAKFLCMTFVGLIIAGALGALLQHLLFG